MLPERLVVDGVAFRLGSSDRGALNAVACQGQRIALPLGPFTHVSLLLSASEDAEAVFRVGGRAAPIAAQSWTGFVGQWDDRIWDRPFGEIDYRTEGNVIGFKPGFVKRAEIAWFATHRHHPELGNEAYRFSYLLKHDIALPDGARSITLPDDPRIFILAASAATSPNAFVAPAAPLYDTLEGYGPLEVRHEYPPPPMPVFEGVEPTAEVALARFESLETMSAPAPSSTDFANGLLFRVIDPAGNWPPHWAAGAENGALPRLTDGLSARNNDDTERCVWFDNEGRFTLDLGAPTPIESIRVYTWHRSDRAPQCFSVWAAEDGASPDPAFAHGERAGWTLLAVVDSRDLGEGGAHRSIITPRGQPTGGFRRLLFVAEDVGQGSFFMEIDVEAEK